MSSERVEFGVRRSVCACEVCTTNCRFMPGFLIPSDLDRLLPPDLDPYQWAERNLLASPGAVVMKGGTIFRIPTLVPATRTDGSCMHLSQLGRCTIHENAPFGCAFFDCGATPPGLAEAGLQAIMEAWDEDKLYCRLWKHLRREGRCQRDPAISRQLIREALKL